MTGRQAKDSRQNTPGRYIKVKADSLMTAGSTLSGRYMTGRQLKASRQHTLT